MKHTISTVITMFIMALAAIAFFVPDARFTARFPFVTSRPVEITYKEETYVEDRCSSRCDRNRHCAASRSHRNAERVENSTPSLPLDAVLGVCKRMRRELGREQIPRWTYLGGGSAPTSSR